MHAIRWAAALCQDLRFGTRLLARSPGFTAASVACLAIGIGVTASLDPVRDGYDAKRAADYFEKLPRRLASVPGIGAVSVAQTLPAALGGVESLITAKVEIMGGPKALGAIRSDRVGAGFFETLGIPVLRGRAFTERDIADGSAVLMVNETMAKQVWPGQDPVGQMLDFEGSLHQVIGVARDIRPPLPPNATRMPISCVRRATE